MLNPLQLCFCGQDILFGYFEIDLFSLRKQANLHLFVHIVVFRVQYILMEAPILVLSVRSYVLLELIKMSIKNMEFERHPAAHYVVVLHQILNQLHIIFGFVIAQEAPNHCDKTVPGPS